MIKVNRDSRFVELDGLRINLTGKEVALMELLASRRGKTTTKEMMLSHLYGDGDQPEVKILDVFVCKIRRKLRLATGCEIIRTDWGRGYAINLRKK